MSTQENKEFEPFREEWIKEMMKMDKRSLIEEFLKPALMKINRIEGKIFSEKREYLVGWKSNGKKGITAVNIVINKKDITALNLMEKISKNLREIENCPVMIENITKL